MSEAGVICCRTGEEINWDGCYSCARSGRSLTLHCPWAPDIIHAMMPEERDEEIHITELASSCLRRAWLMRHYQYFTPIANAYWRARGTLAHRGLAQRKVEPDVVYELFLRGTIEGIKICGSVDKYDGEKKVLSEYKTTKRVPDRLNAMGYVTPWPDHVKQVQMYYKLLLESGFEVNHIEIIYIDMETSVRVSVQPWEIKKIADLMKRSARILHTALEKVEPPEYRWNYLCEGYCDVSHLCHQLLDEQHRSERKEV